MATEFTARADRSLRLARAEAARGGREPGTFDLLLGLVLEGSGLAGVLLTNAGVTERALRGLSVAAAAAAGGAADPPLAEWVGRATDEARAVGDGHVGTEHLLLALVRETPAGRSVVASLLATLGVDPAALRRDVLLATGHAEESGESPA
jgi:ATP-dependent Clp protease ATP-binding subunit ClpA